ncbi:hypothetical protein EDD36DRAFT_487883 [Exophiala viscosa]|uniref:Transcription factor domain-containing protein n=1 Tax=Exophiala viscosa TaxID=2486360 RepID=A0AAN6DXT3_9EURO|nr:hypothetical protein EDD36DRAFT_487883 [Exophiala viscosa]
MPQIPPRSMLLEDNHRIQVSRQVYADIYGVSPLVAEGRRLAIEDRRAYISVPESGTSTMTSSPLAYGTQDKKMQNHAETARHRTICGDIGGDASRYTATPSGRYLFINKKIEDIGKKDAEEVSVIRSHVHGEHRRWRRQARIKALKRDTKYPRCWPQTCGTLSGPATKPASPTQTDRRSTAHPTERPNQRESDSNRRGGPAPAPFHKSRTPTDNISKNLEKSAPPRRQSPATSPSLARASLSRPLRSSQNHLPGPSSLLGSGSSDPFSAAALPITALKHDLINFWQYRFLRAVCPSGDNPGWMERTKVMWLEEIRAALAIEVQLHGLFAGALVFMIQGMSLSQERRQVASLAIQHKVSCLRSLRDAMTQPKLRFQVLKGMYIASTMHFFAGEIIEADLHAKAIAALVKQVGRLGRLDRLLTFQLVILDMNLAYVFLQRPRLATSDWEPGSWAEQQFAGFHKHSQAPASIRMSTHPYLQSHRETLYAKHLVQQIAQVNSISGKLTQTATRLSEDIQGWIRVRRFALSSQCLSLYFDIGQQIPSQQNATTQSIMAIDLQQCLCLGLEYCKRIIFLNSWEQVNVEIQFAHLRHPLARILDRMADVGTLEKHVEILFFLFFVGAVGEELGLIGPMEAASAAANSPTRWFSKHMAIMAVRLGLLEFEETKAPLPCFSMMHVF